MMEVKNHADDRNSVSNVRGKRWTVRRFLFHPLHIFSFSPTRCCRSDGGGEDRSVPRFSEQMRSPIYPSFPSSPPYPPTPFSPPPNQRAAGGNREDARAFSPQFSSRIGRCLAVPSAFFPPLLLFFIHHYSFSPLHEPLLLTVCTAR